MDRMEIHLQILFSMACAHSILGMVFSPVDKKMRLSAVAALIHGGGAVSYFLMSRSWCPNLVTAEGRRLELVRTLEWSLTAPLFFAVLEEYHNPPRMLYMTQAVSILLGGFCPMLSYGNSWICFLLSCCLQVYVLRYLYMMVVLPPTVTLHPFEEWMLRVLYVVLCLILMVYPVVWYLGPMTGIWSYQDEVFYVGWMDISSKLLVTSISSCLMQRALDVDLGSYVKRFWEFVFLLDVPVFALDINNVIIYWNRYMEDLTQTKAVSVMGKHVCKLTTVFTAATRHALMHVTRSIVDLQLNIHHPFHDEKKSFNAFVIPWEESTVPKIVFVGTRNEIQGSTAFVNLVYHIYQNRSPTS